MGVVQGAVETSPVEFPEGDSRVHSTGRSNRSDGARTGSVNGRAPLRWAATSWFIVAVCGQLFFALYITLLYGGGALRGDPTVLSAVMPKGYVRGDTFGNGMVFVHLVLAIVIILAGALQLVPQIRRRAPAVHRVTGRSYIVAALMISIGGLYMVWVRGSDGRLSQHLGSSLNAILMMTFGVLAWRAARAREFVAHRRWALRLFLVASGVWFFRIGLMLWLLVFQRPVGFDAKTFEGPFLTTLAFAQTLLPLLVLEGYLWAQERAGPRGRRIMAVVIAVLTCATAAGIVGAALGMWLPRMR